MTKDKWIIIRCAEQERQDIKKQAKEYDMSVAKISATAQQKKGRRGRRWTAEARWCGDENCKQK